ncbi:MAG: hypothetical protein ICV74_09130 [Thermoleophilia bacterium]|nr:hypothetical protein [Thermoleophilia bacterium]
MDAAEALADLTEVSSQIEACVLTDDQGAVLAAVPEASAGAERLAEGALELLRFAEERAPASSRLTHAVVELPDGAVFVVRSTTRVIAAVTVPQPTVGLVFYDLKTCLRHEGDDGRDGGALSREPAPGATGALAEEPGA